MGLLPLDFESSAYTNFATPARSLNDKTFSPLQSRHDAKNRICRFDGRQFQKKKNLAKSRIFVLNFVSKVIPRLL